MSVLSDLYTPLRSVMVGGAIDASLVREIEEQILAFRRASNEPITVLIDSPGGSAALLELLGPGESGENPAQIRTLATGLAEGAAADLLVAGDLAAALVSSRIRLLPDENGPGHAWLAHRIFPRMLDTLARVSPYPTRYGPAADMFADEMDAGLDRGLHSLSLLAGALWIELPAGPDEMIQDAVADLLRFRVVREECEKPNYSPPEALLETLSHLDPVMRAEGEHRLRVLHFLLARFMDADDDPLVNADALSEAARYLDYYADWSSRHFRNDLLAGVLAHGQVFFAPGELDEIRRLAAAGDEGIAEAADRAYRSVEPFWAFTLSLARSLREEAEPLDAVSAWWLGLLDVVVGTDLDRREKPGTQ
jgi:hypothetical protein